MAGSILIPSLRYRDANAAIDWLVAVFGFHRRAVFHGPEGTVEHAELTFGDGMVMLGSASNPGPYPQHLGHPDQMAGRVTSPLYLVVADCAPVYVRAQEHGATVLQELRTMSYGGQAFTVLDPEGYVWSVGEYDPWKAVPPETAAG